MFAIGKSGKIFKGHTTTFSPLGFSWTEQDVGAQDIGDVSAIAFQNNNLGFAIATNRILQTTNGGDTTWITKTQLGPTNVLNDIAFMGTPQVGIVCGAWGMILLSEDSGN